MKLIKPRELAQRSRGLVAGAVGYVQALKEGTAPSPLLLVLRGANALAERIAAQPASTPTPAQRATLLAAGAQIRAMTSRIIVTADGKDRQSVEGEMAELVRRTLTLIERVTADPTAIEAGASGIKVIDVEAKEVE